MSLDTSVRRRGPAMSSPTARRPRAPAAAPPARLARRASATSSTPAPGAQTPVFAPSLPAPGRATEKSRPLTPPPGRHRFPSAVPAAASPFMPARTKSASRRASVVSVASTHASSSEKGPDSRNGSPNMVLTHRPKHSGSSTPSSAASRASFTPSRAHGPPATELRLARSTQAATALGRKSGAAPRPAAGPPRAPLLPLCPNPRIGVEWYDPAAQKAARRPSDGRIVAFFDIDNTLYSKRTEPRISALMQQRIRSYFESMGLSANQAAKLHQRYYTDYGLAIRGLVKSHDIDPLDYDARCDATLPLEDILSPDPVVYDLLAQLDRTKCRVVAVTNAYKFHAARVLSILGVKQFFEACVYCDYALEDFACKPEKEYFLAAMDAVGVRDFSKCLFIDDSMDNVKAAKELGWQSCVVLDEPRWEQMSQCQNGQAFDANVLRTDLVQTNGCANEVATPSPQFSEAAIQGEFSKLAHPARIRLVNILLDACTHSEMLIVSRSLHARLRTSRDAISPLPRHVHLRILSFLDVPDLLRCRQVCTKWGELSRTPWLWRQQALRLTWGDPVPLLPPEDEWEWEELVKGLFWRERNWALGLAQTIDFFEGHTGYVTSIKIKGRTTLVTGSYDETVRVWDLRTGRCTKVLKAKAISCLDFLLDENILCAGLYDTGRVMIWNMKTWELLQTLSGHNKGIRNVALSRDYLISCGQDKAIVVWDWRAGTKIVRLGQQSNVSLGVSIVDETKIVAVTVDGVIRTFSIPRACMIQQFDLHKLGGPSTLGTDKAMLQWFHASAKTITLASKQTVVHLQWQERFAPVEEYVAPSEIRKNVSARTAAAAAKSVRSRKDSLRSVSRAPSSMSIASSRSPSSLSMHRSVPPGGTPRMRADSTASPAARRRVDSTSSTCGRKRNDSAVSAASSARSNATMTPLRAKETTPIRRAAVPDTASPTHAPPQRMRRQSSASSLGRGAPSSLERAPQSARSVSASPFPSSRTSNHAAPTGTPATRVLPRRASSSMRQHPRALTAPHEEEESMEDYDLSGASVSSSRMPLAPWASPQRLCSQLDEALNEEGEDEPNTGPMRYAPDLSAAPNVVEVLHSPDMATGAVDAAKQRIVCSTFSSRAGSDRRLYVSTYHTRDPPVPDDDSDAASTVNGDGSTSPPPDWATGDFVPIGGAWAEMEAELQTPSTRPLAMVVDHESIVVGCQDGTLYRIGFVGDRYRPSKPDRAGPDQLPDEASGAAPYGRPRRHEGVDYVIDDISLLRETWSWIMLPDNAPFDHPGRHRRAAQDHWAQLGLK